jgi:xylose dehydrogenase (NAD/NADP)
MVFSREYVSDWNRRDWQTLSDGGPVRFAIAGIGWFTKDYVMPALGETTFCEATVFVSSSETKAQEEATEAGVDRGITYEQFHEGAAFDDYDALYIATPNALHLDLVESAADHGKPVLCEKPMEATVDRGQQMVDACTDADIPLMIAYRMQTDPVVRRARDLINDDAIGRPVQVHGAMTQQLLKFIPDPNQWRLDPEISGGGAAMDIGLYPLNTTRFLLDEDPMAVTAVTKQRHEEFDEVDEYVAFHLEFDSGVLASCLANDYAAETSHLAIIGTEGQLVLEPLFFPHTDRRLIYERDNQRISIEPPQANQLTEEFDYFAHCLLTGQEPYPDGEHGLVDLVVIDAVYESADQGQRVKL